MSGRDGKLLWRQPLPVQVKFTDNGNAFSAPAIGNLGGNGTLQVVIMTQGWQKDQRTGADSVVAQVSSFDGRTGEPIWKHQPKWMNDSLFEPRVLLADIEGNGKVEVYASIAKRSDGNGSRPARLRIPRMASSWTAKVRFGRRWRGRLPGPLTSMGRKRFCCWATTS